jgi:spore coat polysaccharide biosynthesis protein SpsF (cytidylyltransferase family)
MNNKVGIIVTARVKSSRLKEKVLKKINGLTTIEILLNHIINDKYPVILAIPENKDDDILAEIANNKGIEVYRGEDDSPFHRILAVAEKYNFENIVRITADDILIDLTLLFLQINFHLNKNRDYTYMRKCPEGVAGEVMRVESLQEIFHDIGEEPCEFISYFVKNKKFNIIEYYPPREYQNSFRLTMDYPEDLTLLRILHSLIKDPGTLDMINLLEKNKYLLQINKLPKITIFIPAFRTKNFIIQTIESVLYQGYEDWELIIIDDYSDDNLSEKILEFLTVCESHVYDKIKFFRNSENIGQSKTCNNALEMARGKYIMCLDSDDVLLSNALELMVDIMNSDDEIVGIMPGYNRIDENGIKIVNSTVLENNKHLGCALLDKKIINELKFKENIRYQMGTELYNRLKEDFKIVNLKEVLWSYRRRDGQLTQEKEHPENRN